MESKEGVCVMKYLMTLFWGFLIGQAVNYIGSSLTGGMYNFFIATIIGLVGAVIVILIGLVVPKNDKTTAH